MTTTGGAPFTADVLHTPPAGHELGRPVPVKNGKVGAKLMFNEYSRYCCPRIRFEPVKASRHMMMLRQEPQ